MTLAILYVLAAIGALWVMGHVVWPILDGILFALGRVILDLLNIEWRAVPSHPLLFLRYLLTCLWRGFFERWTGPFEVSSVQKGSWEWRPWFHYTRLD